MSKLTKGLYGQQFQNASELFGLHCGQIRGKDFVHNGGWYNKDGEKLGWGDLETQDFFNIRRGLEGDEMFIILPESASFWNFVERVGIIGSMAAVKPTIEAPGVDYVVEHCDYIITKDRMYLVNRYSRNTEESVLIRGLLFFVLKKEDVKSFLLSTTAQVTT